jgi:hypothetical protein
MSAASALTAGRSVAVIGRHRADVAVMMSVYHNSRVGLYRPAFPVMAGLVPAIHVCKTLHIIRRGCPAQGGHDNS